jgi:hypothetical protein
MQEMFWYCPGCSRRKQAAAAYAKKKKKHSRQQAGVGGVDLHNCLQDMLQHSSDCKQVAAAQQARNRTKCTSTKCRSADKRLQDQPGHYFCPQGRMALAAALTCSLAPCSCIATIALLTCRLWAMFCVRAGEAAACQQTKQRMLTYPLAHVCGHFVSDLHAKHQLVRVQRRQPVVCLKGQGNKNGGRHSR